MKDRHALRMETDLTREKGCFRRVVNIGKVLRSSRMVSRKLKQMGMSRNIRKFSVLLQLSFLALKIKVNK